MGGGAEEPGQRSQEFSTPTKERQTSKSTQGSCVPRPPEARFRGDKTRDKDHGALQPDLHISDTSVSLEWPQF